MNDTSDKTIECEIQAIADQVFGSSRSALEDKIICSFADSGRIYVKGERVPDWFDNDVERQRADIQKWQQWPNQNKVRLHSLLCFLEFELIRNFLKDKTVKIKSALFEAGPSQMPRCVPFAFEFTNCRFRMGLYLVGLELKSLSFIDCRGDLTIRQTTTEENIKISGGQIKRVELKDVDCQNLGLIRCGSREFSADSLHAKHKIQIDGAGYDVHFMRTCLFSRVNAQNCKIREIKADRISITTAQISKDLVIEAKLSDDEDMGEARGGQLNLSGSNVGGELCLAGIVAAHDSIINLTNVTTDTLSDSAKTWPKKGEIRLSGLQYRKIRCLELLDSGPRTVNPTENFPIRMKWLNRQSDCSFPLQPYRELANALKEQGQTRLAARAMAKGITKLRIRTHRGPFAAIWNRIKSITTGHGYLPERSLWWIGLFIAIGAIVFHFAYKADLMAPTTRGQSPTTFNSVVYSLDALLPVIDFDQEKLWVPNGEGTYGFLVQIYGWFHTVVGWILASLAVAAFSGFLRKVD